MQSKGFWDFAILNVWASRSESLGRGFALQGLESEPGKFTAPLALKAFHLMAWTGACDPQCCISRCTFLGGSRCYGTSQTLQSDLALNTMPTGLVAASVIPKFLGHQPRLPLQSQSPEP